MRGVVGFSAIPEDACLRAARSRIFALLESVGPAPPSLRIATRFHLGCYLTNKTFTDIGSG